MTASTARHTYTVAQFHRTLDIPTFFYRHFVEFAKCSESGNVADFVFDVKWSVNKQIIKPHYRV
jgi:hypothetical protein